MTSRAPSRTLPGALATLGLIFGMLMSRSWSPPAARRLGHHLQVTTGPTGGPVVA